MQRREPPSQSESSHTDADEVRARIRERSADIRERELDRALSAAESAGGLTDGQEEALETLADRLTAGLLAPVDRTLDRDPTVAEVCRELFLRDG